ncbi:MAG: cupredoxin domain-containing protein [Candidatus Omnitrophica bacterium]|nr:cupredoxin domain-containing protein [Candidatus Omnitrophota bacterium]
MKKYYLAVISAFCFSVFVCAYSLALDDAKTKLPELSGKIENGVRVVKVKAFRYGYDPDPIAVKLGEKVRIVAVTSDVTHGLAISEFNINLMIEPGETETAEFLADKEGEFTIYCTVYCGSGHVNMRGKFIVEK